MCTYNGVYHPWGGFNHISTSWTFGHLYNVVYVLTGGALLCSNGSIYIISRCCKHLHNAPIHLDWIAAPFTAPGPADYRTHTHMFCSGLWARTLSHTSTCEHLVLQPGWLRCCCLEENGCWGEEKTEVSRRDFQMLETRFNIWDSQNTGFDNISVNLTLFPPSSPLLPTLFCCVLHWDGSWSRASGLMMLICSDCDYFIISPSIYLFVCWVGYEVKLFCYLSNLSMFTVTVSHFLLWVSVLFWKLIRCTMPFRCLDLLFGSTCSVQIIDSGQDAAGGGNTSVV